MMSGAEARGPSPRLILALGLIAVFVYAFPGYMSNDSVQQLWEARSGVRSSNQPPMMAFEWSLLDAIISGPVLMLLVQNVLALAGLYGIFRRVLARRGAAVAACGVLVFPPVLAVFGVIWKDAQMAAYLLAGIAALLDDRRWLRLIGVASVAMACAMRMNAAAACVPVIGLLFEWRRGMTWWRRYLISGGVALAIVVVAFAADKLLTKNDVYMSPATVDIVGVVSHTRPRTDDDLRQVLRGTPLVVTTGIQAQARKVFSARNAYWIDHGDDRLFDVPQTLEQRAALTRAWKELVTSDWGAYFRFRWKVFRELLGMSKNPLWSPVWNLFLESPETQVTDLTHEASASDAQAKLTTAFQWLADRTPLFRPYMYLALALALLILCRDRLTLTMLASGICYELAYFPVAATPDTRYSHWLFICTCCAAVMLFVRRMRGPRG